MRVFLMIVTALCCLFSASAHAQPRCGERYVVQRGDSLSLISLLLSGDASAWRDVYTNANNVATIGTNPNRLPIGISLEMPPCVGIQVAPTPAATQVSLPPANRARGGYVAPIEIVTGGGFAPFTGDDLHNKGMATEIVRAAFEASPLENDIEVFFVNDWDSHLNNLIKRNKFSLGFPWSHPPCANPSALEQPMQIRCEYEYSEPIYIVAIKVYGVKGASRPDSWDELHNTTICQPAGAQGFDLTAYGIMDGANAQLTEAGSVEDCFRRLERDEVNYVVASQFPAELAISELGLDAFVEPIRGVVEAQPLHLVAHTDNAEAAYLWMEQFNAGLEEIKRSGVWDQIVNDHLDRFRASIGR